jgi:hypothetical protein
VLAGATTSFEGAQHKDFREAAQAHNLRGRREVGRE